MSEKLVLKASNLYYISTGRVKMHVLDSQRGDRNALCGTHIPKEAIPQATDRIDPPVLCLKCYACLGPYMRVGKVKLEENEVPA